MVVAEVENLGKKQGIQSPVSAKSQAGNARKISLAEATRITQTMSIVVEDLRMRYRNLSLFLGLLSAGACASSRSSHAEPAGQEVTQKKAERPTSPAPAPAPAGAPKPAENKAASSASGHTNAPAVEAKAPTAQAESDKPAEHQIEVVEEKYDNGVVRKRAEGYRNADGEFVQHGLTSTWYDSGLKWTEIHYKDGIKQGQQRKWYVTGSEMSVGFYDNDVEDGVWTAYHPNGEKAREIHIDHGMWNGPYTE